MKEEISTFKESKLKKSSRIVYQIKNTKKTKNISKSVRKMFYTYSCGEGWNLLQIDNF